ATSRRGHIEAPVSEVAREHMSACPRTAQRDKTPVRSSPSFGLRAAMTQAGQRATEKRKPIALHVAVPTEDESYPVLIGPGLLARLGHELRRSHASARRV